MTIEEIDIVYSEIKKICFQKMGEKNIPIVMMDFILSKILSDIQSIHISEMTIAYKEDAEKAVKDNG